jgi:two-component system nitrate/nitrite sensor histidine kinase NarX
MVFGSIEMNVHSIQGRLGLLFLAFSVLVIVPFVATFKGLAAQQQDAAIINIAGRQRMLAQQMAGEAEAVERGGGQSQLQTLADSSQVFDQTLQAMKTGGQAPFLPGQYVQIPPPGDENLVAQLQSIDRIWADFHGALQVILGQSPQTQEFRLAMQSIQRLSPELVAQSDFAVQLYQDASNRKVTFLRWIQGGFLVSALILLAAGGWITSKSVIKPLKELGASASRIGSGDLETPVQMTAPAEFKILADIFEHLRDELQCSQQELLTCSEGLERRVEQRTHELEALYSVGREISSQLDINQVLCSIIAKTQQLVGGEVVFLCLLDSQGQVMNLRATNGPEQAICQTSSLVQNSTVDQVLAGEQALRCDEQSCGNFCQILAAPYRTSHLAAPLRIGRQIIGALCVGSAEPGGFSDEALNVLTKLANIAAVAVENARLYQEAERAATLEERQRIAAEMHDGLAQTLSYLQMTVDLATSMIETGRERQAVEKLQRVQQGLDQAIEDTRRAIASLQNSGPLYKPLQEQLSILAEELSGEGPAVKWNSSVAAPLLLPHQETDHIVRVVREALLNAQYHSQAKHIQLCLQKEGPELIITVIDDGKGFDLDAPLATNGRHHFGLDIMRARAARINGHVDIRSAPGMGTRVTLSWSPKAEQKNTQA